MSKRLKRILNYEQHKLFSGFRGVNLGTSSNNFGVLGRLGLISVLIPLTVYSTPGREMNSFLNSMAFLGIFIFVFEEYFKIFLEHISSTNDREVDE